MIWLFENLKMKSFIACCFIALCSAVNFSALAQNKDLGEQQYVVVKDYKPVLAESFKISNTPDKDTSTATPPSLSYSISPHAANTTLEISPLKPVKIKDEALPKLYHALAKIGVGNYATTYGELFVNSTRSKNSLLGFHYKHYSAAPDLVGVGSAGYSDNLASLYGKLFVDRNVFTADLNYNRNVVHYYGYDKNDTLIPKDDTRQRFGNFNIAVGLASNNLSSKDYIDYRARIEYNNLSDLFDASEDNFRIEGMVGKYFGKKQIKNVTVDAYYDYNHNEAKHYSKSHSVFSFSPTALLVNDGKLSLKAGLRFDIDDNFVSFLHLYPRGEIAYTIGGNIITFHASLDGGIKKNTLLTTAKINPYIGTEHFSDFFPAYSNEEIDFLGGVKGNFNNKVFFAADARYLKTENLQLFISASEAEGIPRMKVIYDDVTQTQVHAEVSYRANEKLRLSLSAMHIIFDMFSEEKPWHLPATKVSLSGSYNLADKILVNADLFFNGSTYSRTVDDLTPIKLGSWVDVNLGAEYRYSKILSVFVKLNNLGFSRYYIWNGYPTERLNALGGISYAF
jgi:hypothetical protein